MELVVREARIEDAEVIARYNCNLAMETENLKLDPARVTAGVEALLRDGTKGVYYVAISGNRIVGQCMTTFEWSDWRNGVFWWFQSIYVEKESRGKGVFKTLHRHVEKLARERGDVCGLRLYVEQENHPAQNTYSKLGMKKSPYLVFENDFVLGH